MKLTELNPKYATVEGKRTCVIFDCPLCKKHRIVIPFAGEGVKWERTGFDFETTTLSPSIAHKDNYADGMDKAPRTCQSHFFVRNGEIIFA